MASYLELRSLREDGDLRWKVQVAIAEVAYDIFDEVTPVAARVDWAKLAIANPEAEERAMMHYILVDNKTATVAQIKAATDAAVKANVLAAVAAIVAAPA